MSALTAAKADRALQVDSETALDPAEDDAVHAFRLLEGFFNCVPGFLTARFLARQVTPPLFFSLGLEDFDLITNGDLGLFAPAGNSFKEERGLRT